MAESSDYVSEIAGRLLNLTQGDVIHAVSSQNGQAAMTGELQVMVREVRALAASVLRQDETRGIRRLTRGAKAIVARLTGSQSRAG